MIVRRIKFIKRRKFYTFSTGILKEILIKKFQRFLLSHSPSIADYASKKSATGNVYHIPIALLLYHLPEGDGIIPP